MEAFQEDDDEFEEDSKDGSSSNDTLLRKIGMLRQRCIENERLIKKLKMELRLSKYSKANKTSDKEQLRLGWQGGYFCWLSFKFCQGIFVSTFKVFEGWMDVL